MTPADEPSAASVVHACPPDGSGLTPCCERTSFELPRTDRMSSDPTAVTCAAIRAVVFREAADRLHEMRVAEREWLPATGLHKGEQELRRLAAEAEHATSHRQNGHTA
jgi:hypothetical protein